MQALINTLESEIAAVRRKADSEGDPIKRELLFARWEGLCRARFLAKNPDRCLT
jgi:hypothetical protein